MVKEINVNGPYFVNLDLKDIKTTTIHFHLPSSYKEIKDDSLTKVMP